MAYKVSNWSFDPWARGSYGYYTDGSTPGDVGVLQEAVDDRLFFAGGCATGWALGALRSGGGGFVAPCVAAAPAAAPPVAQGLR